MSKIKHHLAYETLALYAAGHLDEARMVVVATHVRMCTYCQSQLNELETLGGTILDICEPVSMSENAIENFWKIEGAGPRSNHIPTPHSLNDSPIETATPLSQYLKSNLDEVKWSSVAPGIHQSMLPAKGMRPHALRLLRIQSGTRIPTHSHQDHELTLILHGQYEDELGLYQTGDIADLDANHSHSPKATGDEACVCLIATSAPLIFKDMVSKVIQPFIGL